MTDDVPGPLLSDEEHDILQSQLYQIGLVGKGIAETMTQRTAFLTAVDVSLPKPSRWKLLHGRFAMRYQPHIRVWFGWQTGDEDWD